MKLGFIGAFISALAILVALGGLAWSVYSEPSSSASESLGLHSVLDSQRQAISDKFYGDPIVQSGGQSDN